MELNNKEVVEVLNNLDVYEIGDREYPYILVEYNKEVQDQLDKVNVNEEIMKGYIEDGCFCKVHLGFGLGVLSHFEYLKAVPLTQS